MKKRRAATGRLDAAKKGDADRSTPKTVASITSYTRKHPCPVCFGHPLSFVPCHGHITKSGKTALCMRIESSQPDASGHRWRHNIDSMFCRCGSSHRDDT